ncbi:MAG: ABC transporter ATP-binding protein [Planctomycetaceae bacterium]
MIDLQNVQKTHRRGDAEVAALRGITCRIPENSFTFILGPSGSGKSTLLYLMGALDEPSAGTICVNGRILGDLSRDERDDYRKLQVGFIFQNFNLLSNLNAVDNVLVPFMPTGVSREQQQRARDILNDVGLGERLSHKPRQLSGGEQQRVAIARALIKKPMLVLADEPTGELDSKTGEEIFSHLRRLHREQNTTVIVVTHDERYITEKDHLLRLQDGQLVS